MKKYIYRRIEERKELLFRSNFLLLPAAIGYFILPYIICLGFLLFPPRDILFYISYNIIVFFSYSLYVLIYISIQNLCVLFAPNRLIRNTKIIDFLVLFCSLLPFLYNYWQIYYLKDDFFIKIISVFFLLLTVLFLYFACQKIFLSEKRKSYSIELGKLWYLIVIYLCVYGFIRLAVYLYFKYAHSLFSNIFEIPIESYDVIDIVGDFILFAFFAIQISFLPLIIVPFRGKGFIRRKLRPLINCVDNNLIYSITILEVLSLLVFLGTIWAGYKYWFVII